MGAYEYSHAYGHESRRLWQEVSRRAAETQSWEPERTHTFLYDLRNAVREVRRQSSEGSTNYYTWNFVLGGTKQMTGDVGDAWLSRPSVSVLITSYLLPLGLFSRAVIRIDAGA